jgi:myosin heavy subunit
MKESTVEDGRQARLVPTENVVDVPMREQRDIRTVTAEIRTLQAQTRRLVLEYAIEIGRRLYEAKEMLPHGEWGPWLKEEVSFSQSTANNFMRIFDEYGAAQITIDGAVANSQTLGNLSYTKALKLLALPEEEREEFVETHDVEAMSTRELEQAIREKNAAEGRALLAEKKREAAERERDAAQAELEEQKTVLRAERDELDRSRDEQTVLREKLDKARASERAARDKLRELQKNPQVPAETLDKIKQEAEQAARQAAELEYQQKAAEMEAAKEKAVISAEKAAAELAVAKKQLAMSGAEVQIFKLRFEDAQQAIHALLESWKAVRTANPETGGKFGKAILDLTDNTRLHVEGCAQGGGVV